MARIKALPGLDVIKGFKGTIDFALWRGLPYARSWPRTPRHHLTPATLAAAALFGEILKSYHLLADTLYEAFQEDAADQPRIPRDIFMSAVYGKLHEATMADFLTLLTECRDSLALLENLLAALRSVATDSLQVRGEDQLFTYKGQYLERKEDLAAGAGTNALTSTVVPAGEVWLLTHACMYNNTSACTEYRFNLFDSVNVYYFENLLAPVARQMLPLSGVHVLVEGDSFQAKFFGCTAGDSIYASFNGYRMTVET